MAGVMAEELSLLTGVGVGGGGGGLDEIWTLYKRAYLIHRKSLLQFKAISKI